MQDKLKPSLLPWELEEQENNHYTVWSSGFSGRGHSIFHDYINENQAPSKEDAAHIVKCVNSHQALVDSNQLAIKYAKKAIERLKWIEEVTDLKNFNSIKCLTTVINQAKAALALAGGESETKGS